MEKFNFDQSGHSILSTNNSQIKTDEYEKAKKDCIQIFENKYLKFEVDKIDNRRTIEVIKNNKFTLEQLRGLVAIETENQELIKWVNSKKMA